MSKFDRSNWATLTLNERLESGQNPQYSLSPQTITVIGRSPDCQIVLDPYQYITVSRRHAEIALINSTWIIKDLGTTNGTLVNNNRISDSQILVSGDRITLGLKGPEFIFECVILNPTVMVGLTGIASAPAEVAETPVASVNPTPQPEVVASAKATIPDVATADNPEIDLPKEKPNQDLPEISEVKALEINISDTPSTSEKSEADLPVIARSTPIEVNIPNNPEQLANLLTSSQNLWGLFNVTTIGEITAHESEISALAFSNDGQMLASASVDKTIKLWNVVTQELIVALPTQKMALNGLAFSLDGQILASVGADKTIKLWKITTQEETTNLKRHKLALSAVAFSPDGKTLASAGADKTIKLWNLNTQEEIASLVSHKLSIDALAFSPDGKTLASAGKDKTIKLWNVATQEEIGNFTGHKQAITALNFSQDGQTLASVGTNESIVLWNTNTQEIIISIAITSWESSLISIASNGQILAVSDKQGKIKLVQI
jgi:WD40 repeat protein